MAEEIIIKYKADISGLQQDYDEIKKEDKEVKKIAEDPIKITADTKSLRTQLKEAQADVAKLSEKFGVTSKEAAQAAKRAAELKDAIADAKNLTDAFNPDAKFAALSSSIGGVVGGFQAYEGALALVGSESEDLQKTLVKLQALMALSQGLQQLGEARDSFKQLGAVIKSSTVFQTLYNTATRIATAVQSAFGVATVATSGGFKLLRAAIVSTGIGALVIALGLVIANFDAISNWIKKSPLGGLANQVGNLVQNFTDFIGVTSQADRNLEKMSKGNARANEAIKNRIDLLKAQGGNEKEIYELSKQMNENELNTLRSTLSAKGKLNEEEAKNFRDLKQGQILLDAEYNAKLKENRQKAAEKAKEDAKKALEEAKKDEETKNEKILNKRDEALKKVSDAELKAQKDLIAKLEAQNAPQNQIDEAKLKLIEDEMKYNNQLLAIRTVFATQLYGVYTDTKKKELQAIEEGNAKIEEESKRFANEQTKLEIQQVLAKKDTKTEELNKLKENLEKQTTSTIEEENKKKLALIDIDKQIYKSSIEFNKKQIEELTLANANYNGVYVQDRLAANEELNNKLNDNNKAQKAEELRQEKEAAEKRKQLLQKNIDELFAFASSGLLLQLGIDPQALSKIKSDIENAIKIFNDPNATNDQKFLAGAQAASSTVLAGVEAIRASETAASEQKIAELNAEKDAELAAAEGNAQKQDIIRQKYDQKIKAEKRKQFEANKRASIIEATIQTALAIIKAAPNPIFMALAAAIGAAQVALIASQPTPKFKDGGMVGKPISDGLLSGKPHSAGGILLEAEGGEYIINKKSTQNHLPLIEAINDGSINDMLNKHYIMPAIENAEKNAMQRNEKRISDIQTLIVNKAINQTLKSIERKGDINTSRIVEAVKGDKFTL